MLTFYVSTYNKIYDIIYMVLSKINKITHESVVIYDNKFKVVKKGHFNYDNS